MPSQPGAGASVGGRARRKSRPRRSPRELRAYLESVFAKIVAEKRPSWPQAFCTEADVSPSTLRRSREVAHAVHQYGLKTAPHKMRPGRAAGTVPPPDPTTDAAVLAEHKRWGRELPRVRQKLREAQRALAGMTEEREALGRDAALLARCLEVLVFRAAERGQADALDVERLLHQAAADGALAPTVVWLGARLPGAGGSSVTPTPS